MPHGEAPCAKFGWSQREGHAAYSDLYWNQEPFQHEKEDVMPFLIFFMLLFVVLGLIWVVAASLLASTALAGIPHVLDKVLNYKGKHCACSFPFGPHR